MEIRTMSITIKREDDSIAPVNPEHLSALEWGLTRRKEIADQMASLSRDKEAVDEALINIFKEAGIRTAANNDLGTIVFKAGSKGRSSFDKKGFQTYLVTKGVDVQVVVDAFKAATKPGKPGKPSVAYYQPGDEKTEGEENAG